MNETAADLANALQLVDPTGSPQKDAGYLQAAQIMRKLLRLERDEINNWTARFISKYMVPFAAAYQLKRLDPAETSFSAVADQVLLTFGTIPSYRFFLAIPAGEGFVEFLATVFESVCPEVERFNSPDPLIFQKACKDLNDYSIIFFHLMPSLKDPFPSSFFNLPTTKSLHRKLAAIHRAQDRISRSPNSFRARSPSFEDAITGLDVMVQWVEGTVTPEDVRERSRGRGGGTMGFDCQMGDLVGYEMENGVEVKECRRLRKGEEMMTCARVSEMRLLCMKLERELILSLFWTRFHLPCYTIPNRPVVTAFRH